MESAIALVTLAAMEIVLGIDNIVFIAILTARLPPAQQPSARRLGLALALVMRVLLLLTLNWVMQLDKPVFYLSSVAREIGIPLAAPAADQKSTNQAESENTAAVEPHAADHDGSAADGISIKDLILIVGGLFLLFKSTREIHHKIEGEHELTVKAAAVSFTSVLVQIALLDIIFSLDSVITAVGMAKEIWIMVVAVIIAIGVMMAFSGYISAFVERHPTIKMLALSFLILIGVMLVAEGFGQHLDKGYIYFAMAFSLLVEMLNIRVRSKSLKKP